MRKLIVLLMLFTGLLTLISGIVGALILRQGLPMPHIVISTIFAILCITHIFQNRRAVIKYIKG